jgi:Uri superfamily endonuclease
VKAVDHGAALLDERLPGWRRVIDPDGLELRHCSECILGQLFGDYDRGLQALGLSEDDASTHGFYRPARSTWERLNAAWRKVLAS